MIVQRVRNYIARERLFAPADKILVALSGGADSVALLRFLLADGYACEAVHCNFHLRGAESDRDEAFVRRLCEVLGVRLHVLHFDTIAYAENRRLSVEMAARELRYARFEELRKQISADSVAVAHHRDDSIETLLLNLVRGTGITGLLGIRPVNGRIVRPFLCVSREEIMAYLHDLKQPYVTDSTNLEDEYVRNKIRLRLLPLLEEFNPSIRNSLSDTAAHLNDVALLYHRCIAEAKERVLCPEGICLEALFRETAPEAVLFEILHPLGFNSAQLKDIYLALRGQSGKQFRSKEWRVVKDRAHLIIEPLQTSEPEFPYRIRREECVCTPDFRIPADKHIACFDADKLGDAPVTFRLWQPGDVFVPFGMKGKKRVSDYLTDRKFSLPRKERQWLLCCGDRVAWLVGERTDNRFRIDETTRRIVIYYAEPKEDNPETSR